MRSGGLFRRSRGPHDVGLVLAAGPLGGRGAGSKCASAGAPERVLRGSAWILARPVFLRAVAVAAALARAPTGNPGALSRPGLARPPRARPLGPARGRRRHHRRRRRPRRRPRRPRPVRSVRVASPGAPPASGAAAPSMGGHVLARRVPDRATGSRASRGAGALRSPRALRTTAAVPIPVAIAAAVRADRGCGPGRALRCGDRRCARGARLRRTERECRGRSRRES